MELYNLRYEFFFQWCSCWAVLKNGREREFLGFTFVLADFVVKLNCLFDFHLVNPLINEMVRCRLGGLLIATKSMAKCHLIKVEECCLGGHLVSTTLHHSHYSLV